ncbi:MAG: redoxin domain-containing protein [Anaerolineae bacterium]
MTTLTVGDLAPDFTLAGHDGVKYTLSQLRGQPVVLAFYPHDFSPTCTQQHACVMRELAQFNDLNARVFGISTDSAWAHKAYAAQQGITYPLLADYFPQGAVAQLYGVFDTERGRANRVTFVIDATGHIAYIQANSLGAVPPTNDLIESLAATGA